MIEVMCKVKNYDDPSKPDLVVCGGWRINEKVKKVELEIKGEKYTFVAKDLIKAIKNCTQSKLRG